MANDTMSVRCCIAGGGPAGMMAGVLLARAGVDVLVLEKHADFLRDFRGDTIHPSTLEIMAELGLLEGLLALKHQEASTLSATVGDTALIVADFSHLPTRCRFIAFMPQWDFLDFLGRAGARYPTFKLRMRAEVKELLEANGEVVGLRASTPEGPLDVRASLVVGADGRHSVVREKAGLECDELGAPMDVLWFRLSRLPGDAGEPMGFFDAGQIFVAIDRGEHWQCGLVIPKGSFQRLKEQGLPAFQDRVATVAPFLSDRARAEVRDWEPIKLLTVRVDRLRRWYRPGLVCIGDAAHAMSPIGGVGINLAIQDAVAAANLLAQPLRDGKPTTDDLGRLQKRREPSARLTQGFQVFIQNHVIQRVLGEHRRKRLAAPRSIRLLARFPVLRRIPARLIGMGFRPEHVRSADQELGARRPVLSALEQETVSP